MPSSGSRVAWKIFFCNFYEINSSQEVFLYCKNFGVDGKVIFNVSSVEVIVIRMFMIHKIIGHWALQGSRSPDLQVCT